MFRILIVDDERVILNGIHMIIEEELKLAFPTDIATASNALKAVELLELFDPDLILTDIRMPVMDGFDLIRQVRKKDPEKNIVILTSHADFAYAQQAIRLGVTDFILKPINQEMLKNTIEQAYRRKQEKKRELLQSSVMELRNMMLYDLSDQELTNVPETIGQIFPHLYFTVIVMAVPQPEDSYPESLENILLGYYDSCHCFLLRERSQLIAICNHQQFLLKPSGLCGEFREASGCEAFWTGISISATSYKALHSLYINAVQRIFYTRHFGENDSLTELSLFTYQDCVRIFLEHDEAVCLSLLREYLIRTGVVFDVADAPEMVYQSFFYNIQLYLENNHIPVPEDLTEPVGYVGDEDALVGEILRKLTRVKMSIQKKDDRSGNDVLVKQLLEYIRQNYRRDVSLEDLADYVGLHPNYVCTVFKKSIGQSYLACIHRERLKEARRLLLETDFTMEQIAGKVGYNSASQFARVFRKYEEVSPSTFRSLGEAERKRL